MAVSGEDRKVETFKINGNQKYGQILYCSAIVLNAKNDDCFQASSKLKESLARFLIDGAKSINKQELLF